MLTSRSLTLAVLGLGLTLMAAGCDRQAADKTQPAALACAAAPAKPGEIDCSHQGSEMPQLALKDGSGKTAQLADFKGKPVLINLWATWCAPCVAELPQLNTLAKGGLAVLAVSQDMAATEKVAPFLKEKGAPDLAPWLDPDNEFSAQYQIQTLPTTIYYGSDGREVWRVTGPRDWTSADTATAVAAAR